jgi:hypothetical protein
MNSMETWVAVTVGQIAIITSAIGGIKWLVKKYLSELRPNGGSSIHDKINKEILPMLRELRESQITIGEKVAKLEGRFEQHLDEKE